MRLILSLCDFTGNWSRPYEDAGYSVVRIDLKHGHDVRLIEHIPAPVHGILAAPPCTEFAGSGARWWAEKGEEALLSGLALVDACLRAVAIYKPVWWALENPVGRLNRWLGPPAYTFNPNEFGDPYTKKTHLWGKFNYPKKTPVAATEGSKMHKLPPSEDRQALRSETPDDAAGTEAIQTYVPCAFHCAEHGEFQPGCSRVQSPSRQCSQVPALLPCVRALP